MDAHRQNVGRHCFVCRLMYNQKLKVMSKKKKVLIELTVVEINLLCGVIENWLGIMIEQGNAGGQYWRELGELQDKLDVHS